jgi:tetratricopeptide (TPR) repeat protein
MKNLKFFFVAIIAVVFSTYSIGQASKVKEDLRKAQDLAKQGNLTEASAIYTQIMREFPDNRESVQGWLILNMKRSPTGEEEAIKQLEELEKNYPKNTGIMFFKAFLQAEHGQNKEALENVNKLVAVQPDSAVNWLLRGQVLEALEENDEALMSCEKATSLSPANADAWQIKAGLQAKGKKFDEAITSYTRAIELSPAQPIFVYNRGCVYCRKGDKKSALADLGKAVAMNPRLKSYAGKDEDYKDLWEDTEFKMIIAE